MVQLIKGRENLKFRSLILIFVAKFDEDLNLNRTPKVWCKMRKRAKSVVQLLYKNGGKSVVWGKLLNKKCGTFEKCGTQWGKIY